MRPSAAPVHRGRRAPHVARDASCVDPPAASRRLAAALLLLLALPAGGCDRLNPDWCAEHAACAGHEYCDPTTNTCRAREAGVRDSGIDHAASDLRIDVRGDGRLADARREAAADGRPGKDASQAH